MPEFIQAAAAANGVCNHCLWQWSLVIFIAQYYVAMRQGAKSIPNTYFQKAYTRLLSIHYTQDDVHGSSSWNNVSTYVERASNNLCRSSLLKEPVKSYSITKLLVVPGVFPCWYAVFLAAVHLQSVKTSTNILMDLHLHPQNHLQRGLSWRIILCTSIQVLMLN